MPEDYKYDIFISYLRTYPNGREAPTYTWVREYLHRELELWLPDYAPLGYQTQVFLDDININIGTQWSLALQQALQTSRCLLIVLSRQYFASEWCKAELKTMQERQKLLSLRTQENFDLIYPIIFTGEKESFPPEVQNIQIKDLSKFARTDSAFKDSSEYASFQTAIKGVCKDLSKMILKAPTWDKDWPVVIPEQTLHSPTVQRPKM